MHRNQEQDRLPMTCQQAAAERPRRVPPSYVNCRPGRDVTDCALPDAKSKLDQ